MLNAYDAPLEVFVGIPTLALIVAFAWIKLATLAEPSWRRKASWGILTTMLFELLLAGHGILREWDRRPPPFLALMACIFAAIVYISRRCGPKLAKLPFSTLIGLQVFRLPLELVMHRAATASIMPNAMSFSGYNFDIVTGATAGVVTLLALRNAAPRWLLWAWNILGSILLLIVVGIALAATPLPHAFGYGQMNTWIAFPPFVLLPGILVPSAAIGHLVIWRKLLTAKESQ